MSGNCAYESPEMTKLLGETLRPGGFDLTAKGISWCNWRSDHQLLDLGCGQGATVRYLNDEWGLSAKGIDPSQQLITMARKKGCDEEFMIGRGEAIPFADASFDGVLSECTLSLMDDLDQTLSEVHRVLKDRGYFFITDVYARKPEMLHELKNDPFKSCMRGLYDLDRFKDRLSKRGFQVILAEDHSELLKQLLVKTIFAYGSMNEFWKKTAGNCAAGFQETLKMCKPGYYMMIARKEK